MQSSLFIAATGLKAHSAGLQTVSNNLANVSTVGYKQQSLLFEDLMYTENPALGSAWPQVWNQTGMGAQTGAVRTLFSVSGGFEPTNSITDLALEGKGFFQVNNDGTDFYTRAGNFYFDKAGFMVNPNGYKLTGVKVVNGVEQGGLQLVQVNWNGSAVSQNPAKVTDAVSAAFNLGFSSDNAHDVANPAFSLLSAWDGTQDPPMPPNAAGYTDSMRLYDATGKSYTSTIHFDGTNLGTGGQSVYEFVVTVPPSQDGSAAAGTPGAGLLMAGTLTFSPSGELINMSSFSPGGGDRKDLNNWTPSALVNGVPQVSMTAGNGQPLNFTLNLGIAANDGWQNLPASAVAVGTDVSLLPGMGQTARQSISTTAMGTTSNNIRFNQSGYGTGWLSGLDINRSGEIVASYSNGQSEVLYRIPVFRFTSEDGLYHEGSNLFSYTDACGKMEYGTAGTENYGKINASTLEMSNVDMAREMTSMIIVQRGFQMNSKSVTTSDEMLKKALELKR